MRKNNKKAAALENVNMLLLDRKLNEYMDKNGLSATEQRCRLVQVVFRHKVPHFPANIPFIAAIKNCGRGQQVVFGIKQSKISVIDESCLSSETTVGRAFIIDGIRYVLEDTVNGFQRYKPLFKRSSRNRRFTAEQIEEATTRRLITHYNL